MRKRVLTGLLVAATVFAGWSINRHVGSPSAAAGQPPLTIDIAGLWQLDTAASEFVGDSWQDGRFRVVKSLPLVTFVTHASSQPDRHLPRAGDVFEPAFYERLLFGDRFDNERDKNECHFRVRLKHPECLPFRPESLLLNLQSGKDAKQLTFEWVNGSLVSRAFILVNKIKRPSVAGLTELLTDSSFGFSIVSRN